MSELTIGERAIIERSETAAERTAATADDLRMAAAALRHVLEVGDEDALRAIGHDAGVEVEDFDQLAGASVTVDGLADKEQSIAGGLIHGAALIREHGLPR
jgi:hypothetical protein